MKVLFFDSECVIHLSKNPSFDGRLKCIDIRYHWISAALRYHWISEDLDSKKFELEKIFTNKIFLPYVPKHYL